MAGVGVLTLLTEDLGALMVFTVTTRGPVPENEERYFSLIMGFLSLKLRDDLLVLL